MSSWRRPIGSRTEAANVTPVDEGEVSDGSLHYVVEKGGNDSQPSYQEATGAPVETNSPLGYNVGAVTIVFLNISKMIGTGVYSTRKCGSLPTIPGVSRYRSLTSVQRRASTEAQAPLGSA
jgi:hypothetical protein